MSGVSNAQSLFQRTFPPLVGCLTSPSVEQICQRNSLSFAELLRPFCNVYVDNKLRDPSGNDLPIKHLKIGVQDVKDQPPAPAVARRLLNEAVAGAWCEVTKQVDASGFCLDIPIECPWYQAWMETFLQVQYPSEHEFLRHLLGCILVASSQDPPETMQSLLETLKQLQIPAPSKLPKWFCPAIFKFYVVVHDARAGDRAAAAKFFESIRTAYGADNCYFLEINSRQPGDNVVHNLWADIKPKTPENTPEFMQPSQSQPNSLSQQSVPDHPLSPLNETHNIAHDVNYDGVVVSAKPVECGTFLSTKDLDSLREVMVLVVRNALLPHVEKQIFILNDLVANKKGVSRSLLSATKRLFGSPRPVGSPGTPPTASPFSPDAAELQIRRLGDLYFLFSSYANAFQAYYNAKRELGMEQAWLHYAGALEMAALSAFMTPEPTKKALEYIEEAIVTYQTSCQLPQFAVRATVLGIECLKERDMYSEAAKQLIKMANEDSDLRSALLLEQAAYCVLRESKPRKYAFQMVLAGHRYTKAGQRRHALRCVRQALQVYDGRGWSLAEDYIYSTIGRLAGQLHSASGPQPDPRLLGEGLHALGQLLHLRSRQAAGLQAAYLLEYLNMHQTWVRENPQRRPPIVPLPVAEDNSACVRVVARDAGVCEQRPMQADTAEQAALWARMEELALTETVGPPMVFKPTLSVFSRSTANAQGPIMAVNERLEVQVGIRNPLQISLPLSDLHLLWTWRGEDGSEVEGDGGGDPQEARCAATEHLPSLLLPPLAINYVTLSLQPRSVGTLQVHGISFALTTAVAANAAGDQVSPIIRGRQDINARGPKLRPLKDRPNAEHYADDRRLLASVVPAAPMLTVRGLPSIMEMVCGEMAVLPLELSNSGTHAVTSLHAVVDAVGLLTFPRAAVSASKSVVDSETNVSHQVVTLNLSACGGSLQAGGKLALSVSVRAPATKGPTALHLMFLYSGASKTPIRHRVARTTIKLVVSDGLQMTAVASRSQRYGSDALSLCLCSSNYHTDSATVTSLVMAARQWSLNSPALFPKESTLEPNESIHFVASARFINEESAVCSLSSVQLGVTTSSLNEETGNWLLQRAASQLVVLGLLWQATTAERTISGLTIVELEDLNVLASSAPLSGAVAAGIDAAYPPRTLVIFGPDRELPAAPAVNPELGLVTFSISHEHVVNHDFSSNRICLIDIRITVRNTSGNDSTVEINPCSGDTTQRSLSSHVYNPHASSAFTWAGRARARLSIAPHAQSSLLLRAAVTKPGTYDVAVRISVAMVTESGIAPLPPASESPVVVTDAAT